MPGEVVLMTPGQGPVTIGGNLRKAPALWAGTATVTGPALDVGASQAGSTQAAVTPGWAAGDQILQTRALQTRAPSGGTLYSNLTLRVTLKAGGSQRRPAMELTAGGNRVRKLPMSGGRAPNPEVIKAQTNPQVTTRTSFSIKADLIVCSFASHVSSNNTTCLLPLLKAGVEALFPQLVIRKKHRQGGKNPLQSPYVEEWKSTMELQLGKTLVSIYTIPSKKIPHLLRHFWLMTNVSFR